MCWNGAGIGTGTPTTVKAIIVAILVDQRVAPSAWFVAGLGTLIRSAAALLTASVAIRSAAHRGVETTIIFPTRNDDFAVGATSRSHYESLLDAGVRIFEYGKGLLHTKSLTLDGEVTLIGSANMDRRSFDLNFENNILLQDQATTAAMRARQDSYLADSRQVTAGEVAGWGMGRRLRNNAMAIVGPVL